MAVVVTEVTVVTVRVATEDGMPARVARRAVPLVNSLLNCEFLFLSRRQEEKPQTKVKLGYRYR